MDTILNRRLYGRNKRAWLLGCILFLSLLIANHAAYGANTWQTETSSVTGSDFSLAMVDGQPTIGYYNYNNGDLMYARYDGATWHAEAIDNNIYRFSISLAVVNNQPAISYIDATTNIYKLKYAHYDGTTWHTETIDPNTTVGGQSSLAEVNGQPAISYLGGGGQSPLKYARYDGANWQIQTVDNDNTSDPSLAVVNGQPAIVYAEEGLKYARYDGANWQIQTVDNGEAQSPSLVIVDGQPAIGYKQGRQIVPLKYARYDGASWQIQTIHSDVFDISPMTIVGGQPALSYLDFSDPNVGKLTYARYDGTTWHTEELLDTNSGFPADILTATTDGQPIVIYRINQTVHYAQSQSGDLLLVSALAAANAGDTITLDPAENYTTEATVSKSVTIDLNGQTMTAGATPLTISAANVTIKNGKLDGSGATIAGLVLGAGVNSVTLENVEITGFSNGVQIDATIDGFKLVNSYIHDNSGHGVHIASGVSLNGLVSIQGNLFKNNGGNGLNNEGDTANLLAQYNNWGDVAGATGANGDGVSANVDASNPTYAKFYVDVIPATLASTHSVLESDQFTVDVDVDAAGLYALHYQLSYDSDLVTLNSTVDGDVHGTGACVTNTETAGVVDVLCYRLNPDADVNAAANVITSLTFTADLSGIGTEEDGAWTNLFDLNHVSAEIGAGARSGINIFVDTDDIADTDDGNVVIRAIGQYAGLVDLEGRVDDSGATITVHNDAARTTQMATATTTADGRFLTVYEATEKMIIGSEYHLTIDAPLALATDITEATLHDRPITNLTLLTLLGGDATDDESISLADATCIAGDFGGTISTCVTGSSDVNGDGNIDLIDLSLMGGNFGSSSSSWTP